MGTVTKSTCAPAAVTVECRPGQTMPGRLHLLFEASADDPRLSRLAGAVKPLASPGTSIYDRARIVRLLVDDSTGDEVERVVETARAIIPNLEIGGSCRERLPARAER